MHGRPCSLRAIPVLRCRADPRLGGDEKDPGGGDLIAGLEPGQHLVHPVRFGADGHLLWAEAPLPEVHEDEAPGARVHDGRRRDLHARSEIGAKVTLAYIPGLKIEVLVRELEAHLAVRVCGSRYGYTYATFASYVRPGR
jgi:hypothetical protein